MSNPLQAVRTRVKQSIIPKIVFIGLLVILLLLPVTMIEDLMRQRSYTKDAAISEVARRWGGRQTIAGPIITIPFREKYRDKNDSVRTTIRKAHFLPSTLNIVGDVEPEVRRRGIFDVLLYRTKFEVEGSFNNIDFSRWNVRAKDILWNNAYLSVGIPDTRGIKKSIKLEWNDTSYVFGPSVGDEGIFKGEIGVKPQLFPLGESTRVDSATFKFGLELNGSRSLGFVPLGAETNVQLRSEWPHPGFTGEYLPDEREVSGEGFAASWKINYIERRYPQEWRGGEVLAEDLEESCFGVNLIIPVDTHQQSMRSAKYASLFILLSFVVFFLIEILNKIRVHPIQYFLVGFAICLFYLLLVSLSEHIDFSLSYAIASISCIGVIGGYSRSVLTSGARAGIIMLVLAALYAILFVLLQLQEYALIVGSIGLFLILATLMYLTRKIDWYNVNRTVSNQVSDMVTTTKDSLGPEVEYTNHAHGKTQSDSDSAAGNTDPNESSDKPGGDQDLNSAGDTPVKPWDGN